MNVPDVLFVNTVDARRSAQRETRFGFTLSDEQRDRLKLDTIRLGVYLTMPAYYGEITACKNHSKKFSCNRFFHLHALNKNCVMTTNIEGESERVYIVELPLENMDDPYICNFRFVCYSSCFTQLSSKNFLQINYLVLTHDNTVEKKEFVIHSDTFRYHYHIYMYIT